MNGQLKTLLILLGLGGVLGACETQELGTPLANSAELQAPLITEGDAALQTTSSTPSEETYVDISGCWKEVQLKDNRVPVSSSFNIYKVEANAFTFHKPPQHTKYVIKPSLTFQEVNYDDNKPFLPVGTIFSAGNIADNGNTIIRFVNGQHNPHTYRRCQLVYGQPIEKETPVPETESSAQPLPEATLAPLVPQPSTSPLPSTDPSPEPNSEPTPGPDGLEL